MMFGSNLKIALRNFLKYRLYSLINVLGLAAGLTCCLLIALYIADESSYDTQHPDAERIYRLSQTFTALEEPIYLGTTAPQAGPLLKEAFMEVEAFSRIWSSRRILTDRTGSLHEEELHVADPSIAGFFAFEWLQGDPRTALSEPFSIVLTQSFARRYFDTEDPLGQTLLIGTDEKQPLRVTGVIADLPRNMHFTAGAFVSMNSMPALAGPDVLQDWNNANFTTYLKLQLQADYGLLEAAFAAHLLNNMPESMRSQWAFSGLQLPDIHLHSPLFGPGMRSSGNLSDLVTLVAIAAGLLLIAGVNFVNLSTALSLRRSKEVAVRKAVGSSRGQLFQQFASESCLMVAAACVVAVMLVEVALPQLNAFTNKDMVPGTLLASVPAILLLLAMAVVLVLLAGGYPALYLSALRPAEATGKAGANKGMLSLRNLLVIAQFAVSIVLVIATLTVQSQVRYGKTLELGFSKNQLLIVEGQGGGGIGSAWQALKNELMRHPQIIAGTASSMRPFELFVSQMDVRREGGDQPGVLTQIRVDHDFFETYEVPLLAGRTFSEAYGGERRVNPDEDNATGSAAFVLNRAAIASLGWEANDALGKWFEMDMSNDFSRTVRGPVVGVVEDMRIDSLYEAIKPTFYYLASSSANLDTITLRLTGRELPETLAYIDSTWKKFYPDRPILRSFVDADFQALYEEEERFAQLLGAFASLTIVISCLGLFGLTAFAVERRTREIGVRKVMGGSVWSIVLLLTNDFSRLVLLANLVAWPVAYVAMNRWLENFAYRIDLTPLVFIGSGLIALCIAWVTVGGTAAKAATAKPVLALRYE